MAAKKSRKQARPEAKKTTPARIEIGWGWILLGLSILVFLLFANTLARGHLIHGSDQLISGYMFKSFVHESLRATGQFPLWNPYIFGGLPYIDAFHGDVFYITALLRTILPVGTVMALVFVLQIIVAGIFTYGFLRTLDCKKPVALVGAVAYMFTCVIVSLVDAGHDGKVIVASFLPAGLFFIQKAFNPQTKRRLMYFALMALVIGLALLSPHVQMTYYLLMMMAFYIIFRFFVLGFKRKRWGFAAKSAGLSFGSLALGFAISAIQFLPAISYLGLSPRGAGGRGWEWNTSWSLPRAELFDLFNPRFSGILGNYWGANAFKQHSEYFGIIILALAIVGIILAWKRRETKFFTFFGLFAILMALGGNTPFYRIPYTIFPMLSSFRAPAMIFFTVSFSVVVLAALGLEAALERPLKLPKDKKGKADTATVVFIVVAGLLLIFGLWSSLAPHGFGNFVASLAKGGLIKAQGGARAGALLSKMRDNLPNAAGGFWLGFLFTGLGLAVILLWRKLRKLRWLWGVILAAVVFIDLWLVDRHFVNIVKDRAGNPLSAGEFYAPDEVVSFLEREKGVFRVFPLQFRGQDLYRNDDYLMLYHIQSVGGYHGNQLGRYQEFIDVPGEPRTIMFRNPRNLRYPAFLTMLDVGYLIALRLPDTSQLAAYSPQDQQTIMALHAELAPWIDTTRSSFRPVYTGQRYAIYRNYGQHSRAWLCTDVEVIEQSEAILTRMKRVNFDPLKTVILEEKPQVWQPSADPSDTTSPGDVQITRYEPNVIEIAADVKRPAVLVLSENWYPYYRAWVDRVEQKVYRADYTLRAVTLEPGRHQVVFRFRSPYQTAGVWITFVALGLVGLAVVLSLVAARKKKS